MSTQLKNGKKPLSSKPKRQSEYIREGDLFGNPLSIPPHIQEELKAKGLEGRFVDNKKLQDNYGYHDKGWTPYKKSTPTASDTIDKSDTKIGADPDGAFRRGSLILAVKPIEAAEKHRTLLKQKANRQKQHTKARAAELRQMAKESFGNSEVFEGYEENDDESDE